MSPTEHQRCFTERAPARPRRGLDVWAHGLVGRYKRGPWQQKRLAAQARAIAALREELEQLADAALNERFHALQRERRRRPQHWQPFCREGLAILAVLAHRELGLRAYEVQLMAAVALVEGFFAEVDTGEGKTLAIGLAAAFQALGGVPCHVITANDYLAERDSRQLRCYYDRAGLRVGAVLSEHDESARRAGYACGVTYTTAKEVAADYLRDRLRMGASGMVRQSSARLFGVLTDRASSTASVQRGLHSALIDEADHALIDEAVTPLIISHMQDAGEIAAAAHAVWDLVRTLEPIRHYRVDAESRTIEMLPPGLKLAHKELSLPRTGLWASERRRIELVGLGLEAREFFLRDKQYVIDEGKVVIVDPATGRPMPMRTWRQGLHQIIEAKEGLEISGPSETLARMSFQAFFRKYHRLAGASGTLHEAAAEIWHTYNTPFVSIPRHLPCQRQFAGVRFFATHAKRDAALLHEIKIRHARGQPLLIGTHTVESSEVIADLFHNHGLPGGQILNARRHREEAVIVSQAGQEKQIIIATGMAGRGTDISLGKGVAALGGLHVVATEVNESARVDRQLFGRAARQGDPGSVISFYSAEYPVLRRFVPDFLVRTWSRCFRVPVAWVPQVQGRLLLWWTQRCAQRLSARRRRSVMLSEEEIRRSLGFTMGRNGKNPAPQTKPRGSSPIGTFSAPSLKIVD
jgi:preprotein translocase subunit SecA